jgi:hypothetical protein
VAKGEDMKKLREIARTHIEKAAAGDMQAIKELADRLSAVPILPPAPGLFSTTNGCASRSESHCPTKRA